MTFEQVGDRKGTVLSFHFGHADLVMFVVGLCGLQTKMKCNLAWICD